MLIAALVLLTLVLIASISHKINIPVIILSLVIGIVFGSDVLGVIYFDDAVLAKEIANIALMFILFIGGFGTKKHAFRAVIKPVSLLATVGILLTAMITGWVFHLISGWPLINCLLIGSILASTDAAAVFSVLKNRQLDSRIKSITELESVANDPMAIVLTMFVIDQMLGTQHNLLLTILSFLWQLAGGIGIGVLIGNLAAYAIRKIRQNEPEFFFVYLIAIVMLSYSIANILGASGMLSAFFAGFVMGNKNIPYKKGLLSFNNTLSFITNVGLFILLGLLVFPGKFYLIWDKGVIIFLILSLLSRPITVFFLTSICKLSFKEQSFLSAVGIRGAVPIVLATYPAAMGLDPEHEIFNIVFFVVTLSMIVQGTSLIPLAKKLKLLSKSNNSSSRVLELVSVQDTNYEIVEVYIDEEYYHGSIRISEMKLPKGTLITFVRRGDQIMTPTGSMEIFPKDTLTVLVENQYIDMIAVDIMRSFVLKKLDEHKKEKIEEAVTTTPTDPVPADI
ncbi:MAG: potassium/proton antiporter [Candidatus Cloacimonetes bacterium HGW-Cloacimonetes-2]|jgi:cell volume regulation protein A|nr:MAG: potassium/proton antiporter [Candidatus Cloacimonetes bacterium HGW-Cloacimonetes-2]